MVWMERPECAPKAIIHRAAARAVDGRSTCRSRVPTPSSSPYLNPLPTRSPCQIPELQPIPTPCCGPYICSRVTALSLSMGTPG